MKNNKNLVGILIAALVAFGAIFYFSPYLAVNEMKKAMVSGDSEKIETLVDFPALRENVKGQLMVAMQKNLQNDPSMASNPFAGLATMVIPNLVTGMLDTYVTAESFSKFGEETASSDAQPPNKKTQKSDKLEEIQTSAKWISMDRADIVISIAGQENFPIKSLKLRRKGLLGWQLFGVKLDEDIMSSSSAMPN